MDRGISLVIDAMTADDWPLVRHIYQEGIHTGDATFETEVPAWEIWDQKYHANCRLVARRAGEIVGWAALSPTSARQVYAGVAEVSIYVAASARGQGVGTRLLKALVEASEQAGFWTLQAGIFPENASSIALHYRMGFRQVGVREHIGHMNGRWRDVVLLERRSKKVGD